MSNLTQWLIVAVAAGAAVFLFVGRKGPEPSLQPAVLDVAQLASISP